MSHKGLVFHVPHVIFLGVEVVLSPAGHDPIFIDV